MGYEGGEDFFDSDKESEEEEDDEQNELLNDVEDESRIENKRHDCSNSYAWLLIRLALSLHMKNRLTQFLLIAGFDFIGNPFFTLSFCF